MTADVIAGLTVAAILVPEGMAYAQVAGVAAEIALYTIPPALILCALYGWSRQLVVATSGAIAVLSATIVGSIVKGGTQEYVAYSAALALFAGVISLLCGVLKLGLIAQFFSESVEGNFLERLWDILRHLGDADRTSVVLGVATIVVMLLIERLADDFARSGTCSVCVQDCARSRPRRRRRRGDRGAQRTRRPAR